MRGRSTKRAVEDNRTMLNLPSTLGNVPKISLGGRCDGGRDKFVTPGPSYIPKTFGHDARYSTFGNLPGIKSKPPSRLTMSTSFSPGPAAYNTFDHTFDASGEKGIKMKGCHNFSYNNLHNPGPGRYAPRYNSVLASAPKPTFHIRPKDKDPEPGVGFKDLGSTLGGPSFTMKARRDDDNINLIE
jgi:hypothetical protein